MQRTLQQKAREAADRTRCNECGEQRTCTSLMAKACLKGFIRGYVEAKKLSGSERSANVKALCNKVNAPHFNQ